MLPLTSCSWGFGERWPTKKPLALDHACSNYLFSSNLEGLGGLQVGLVLANLGDLGLYEDVVGGGGALLLGCGYRKTVRTSASAKTSAAYT